MRVFERSRRVATIALVAALMALPPQIAIAGYSTPQPAVQSVATATMTSPSGLTGTWDCKTTGGFETMDISIDFTHSGLPAGTTYEYLFASDNGYSDFRTSSAVGPQSWAGRAPNKDNVATAWTLTITAVRYQWSSQPLVRTIICPASGSPNGTY